MAAAAHGSEPDLAEAFQLRDVLLLGRGVLLGADSLQASALAHIDALLDLDDEASPGLTKLIH